MLTLWIVVIVLGVLELFETVLLVLLLRALGQIQQNGGLTTNNAQSPDAWGLAVGEKAPAFTGTDQDGNTINFEDFQGQKRVIAFVSSSCLVCVDLITAMNALVREEPSVVVLAIGDSDVEHNRMYAADHNAMMPILATPSQVEKEIYSCSGYVFCFRC